MDLSKLDIVVQHCLAAIHGIRHDGRIVDWEIEKTRKRKQR